MRYIHKIKRAIAVELLLVAGMAVLLYSRYDGGLDSHMAAVTSDEFIKWVDFNVSYEALCEAYELDVATYGQKTHVEWIPLLAYTAAKNGGKFDKAAMKQLRKAGRELAEGDTTMEELSEDLKYYDYYLEAYGAVLGGFVGKYRIEVPSDTGKPVWKEKYGLKSFSPIAKGFPYSDYDDFGSSRSYGYSRPHLGHDMMGQIGTPIGIISRA